MASFVNPIYCGQDPFVCKGPDGMYYSVAESANAMGIDLFVSDCLTVHGKRKRVFDALPHGKCSADLWAPELWYLRGRWYLYFAGAEGAGEEHWDTHRMFVLESENPEGPYKFCGELELGERMSIDGTVMELPNGKLIFFYMGRNDAKTENCLFMAPMDSPTHICGTPVELTSPTYDWESDICEGPFPLVRKNGISLIYSANAAHLPEYCISQIFCKDINNILNPQCWEKLSSPLVISNEFVRGPGHVCITKSPDDKEDWMIFHSKYTDDNTLPGGWDRVVSAVPVNIDDNAKLSVEALPAPGRAVATPSGQQEYKKGTSVSSSAANFEKEMSDFCYARKQTHYVKSGRFFIDGRIYPEAGNKMLIEGIYDDFILTCEIGLMSCDGSCGLMFRVTNAAVGPTNWNGYAVKLTADKILRLICCNGKEITILSENEIEEISNLTLRVKASGEKIQVYINEKCVTDISDSRFSYGNIGLYSPDGLGEYGTLSVELLK